MATAKRLASLGDVLAQSKALTQEGRVSWQQWRAVVGSRVAARSRPDNIDAGTLWVTVTSNAWAQELSMLRRTIIGRLRGAGAKIERLRFRVGKVEPLRPPRQLTPARPASLPPDLAARIAQIDDAELRDAITEAAGYQLGLERDE